VQISSIKLTNFRNYAFAEFSFQQNITVIAGNNGIGKTNLLEAISLLAPGKGIRSASLEELKKADANNWSIFAAVEGYNIGTGQENNSNKRIVKIDGEQQKGANILAQYFSCIWLTPQMDGIFIADNSERRKFFDRIIYNFDPEHASRVAIYENAMRERLRLLKDGSADNIWLKTLEKRMAEYGIAIAAARTEIIHLLQNAINESTTGFLQPQITIDGKYENILATHSALETELIFAEDLFNARYIDANTGRTTNGVHRTDFRAHNNIKNIGANNSSTGEQKAMLLTIILSLARMLKKHKNRTPVILLDEVIAHLDENRRQQLFDEIKQLGCQAFLTGTDGAIFKGLEAEFLSINNKPLRAA